MRHRVPGVQDGAAAGFSLVRTDDRGLDLDASAHQVVQGDEVSLDQSLGMLLDPLEILSISNDSVLDRLGQSAPVHVIREGEQDSWIGQHGGWGVERTHEVLSSSGIY